MHYPRGPRPAVAGARRRAHPSGESGRLGEMRWSGGPPVSGGGGSERERVRGGRPVSEGFGRWALALGQMASWASWGAPGSNPVSV